jgi:hypothetical protein
MVEWSQYSQSPLWEMSTWWPISEDDNEFVRAKESELFNVEYNGKTGRGTKWTWKAHLSKVVSEVGGIDEGKGETRNISQEAIDDHMVDELHGSHTAIESNQNLAADESDRMGEYLNETVINHSSS